MSLFGQLPLFSVENENSMTNIKFYVARDCLIIISDNLEFMLINLPFK